MSRLSRPLVSVIIPSYNHVNFVEQAIRSVLEQTIKNIEVIVVDDGSTDGTADVLRSIVDERVKLTCLPTNRTVNTRNIATRLARGKFVAFQNSDDVWKPQKLESQLRAFDQKNVVACFTGVQIIDEHSKPKKNSWADKLFVSTNKSRVKWLRYFFDNGNAFCISSAMVRTSALKKVGPFDESLFQLSDFDMWLRLCAVGEISILPQKLTKMRIVGNNNISFPSPGASRRSIIERAHTLDRYTQELLKPQLSTVFKDIMLGDDNMHPNLQLALLAEYAWSLGPAHRLFGDRLFSGLIRKPKDRRLITDHFGANIINDFIKNRSMIEIIIHE